MNCNSFPPCNDKLYAINSSPLKVFGKIKCSLLYNAKAIEMDIFVVCDKTMTYECILWRDFLRKCKH